MPERYWLTWETRHRHKPPTQEIVYYQREGDGDRWRLYYGKHGRRRSVGTDAGGDVRYQVDLAKHEGRFLRHETDSEPSRPAETRQLGMFSNPLARGYSRQTIGANVAREMHAGRDQPQAVAIALETARRSWRRRHPRGRLPDYLRRAAMRNPVTMMQTGAGYYVSGACGTGGRSFPRGKDGKRAAQLYTYEQRRIEDAGCRNPNARRYRAFCGTCYTFPHHDGSMAAASRWATSHLSAYPGHDVSMVELRRNPYGRRRRHRNPDHGDILDLALPALVLFLLIRGGTLRPAA